MEYAELVEKIEHAYRAGESILDISKTTFCGVEWKRKSTFPPVHLRFTQVQFDGDICFSKCTFQAGVSFIDVDFKGKTSFARCKFNGPAYFWKCRFHKDTDFSHVVVSCSNFPESDYEAGELNFSYSIFLQAVSFRHAVVHGPTFFWRTVFECEVDFEVAQFHGSAQFMGRQQDILIAEAELPEGASAILLDAEEKSKAAKADNNLESPKILLKCEDREPDSGYYNFDSTITSKEELEIRLNKRFREYKKHKRNRSRPSTKPLLERGNEEIVALWEKYHAQYMFNNKYTPKFMEVSFGPKSEFRHVSLRKCLFRRADLSNVRFDSIVWESGTNVGRERIFDEVHLDESIKNFVSTKHTDKVEGEWVYRESIAVSNLYHQLRLRADVAGDRRLARNFYYGEMEMARQAEPSTGRAILPGMYKHLSGYGTRELQALAILLALLFGFWPTVYLLLDKPGEIKTLELFGGKVLSSEVTSLEAATFLLRPAADAAKNNNINYPRRFAEGVERILVSIQAGLFVLSLKSKFQRGPE